MASSYNESWSGGIGAAGGESASGGLSGGQASNEVMEKGWLEGSQSGGASYGRSESGSVFAKNVMVDGYSRLNGAQPPSQQQLDQLKAMKDNSEPSTNKTDSPIPVMVVSSYNWGAHTQTRSVHHTLAARANHNM